MVDPADISLAAGATGQPVPLRPTDNRSVRSGYGKLIRAGAAAIMLTALALPVAFATAQVLDQDAFVTEKGPHFFDNKCCFCKEVTAVKQSEKGYYFTLDDGRELFVDDRMIRPSVDGNNWYCPAYQGSERCGLIHLGV